MGRLLCLFVCYGGQKLRCAMDGGGSICIEEGLRNGWSKVSIRCSMKEKSTILFGRRFLLVLAALRLLSWLLMNSTTPIIQPNSCVNHCKNKYEDDAEEG
jgi:hypothetical protein